MILCISASPALDVTYRVPRLTLGASNRVSKVSSRPGGKATNVARLLKLLGEDVRLLTTAGGDTGSELVAGLRSCSVDHEVVHTASATRRTLTIVDETSDAVTVLNEPARLDDWQQFLAQASALIPGADVVVISGSLPIGAPVDGYAQLIRVAHQHRRPVVLDTSGPAFVAGLEAEPTIVKPNADELLDVTAEADPHAAAHAMADRFRTTVVASLGAEGLIAVERKAAWRARPREPLVGNPTGAGDAVVAALARGLRVHTEWVPLLSDCIALGSAAVLAGTAGELNLLDYQRESAGAVVEAIVGLSR